MFRFLEVIVRGMRGVIEIRKRFALEWFRWFDLGAFVPFIETGDAYVFYVVIDGMFPHVIVVFPILCKLLNLRESVLASYFSIFGVDTIPRSYSCVYVPGRHGRNENFVMLLCKLTQSIPVLWRRSIREPY